MKTIDEIFHDFWTIALDPRSTMSAGEREAARGLFVSGALAVVSTIRVGGITVEEALDQLLNVTRDHNLDVMAGGTGTGKTLSDEERRAHYKRPGVKRTKGGQVIN